MITLPNGHKFEYLASGGALGYDGQGWLHEQPLRLFDLFEPRLFTAVTKTLTLNPTRGNLRWYQPWDCIQFVPDGVINAVGLTNIGFGRWCEQYGSRLDRSKQAVVASFTVDPDGGEDSLRYLEQMVRKFNTLDLVGIQYNPSCPNVPGQRQNRTEFIFDAIYRIREVSGRDGHPLSLKLGYDDDVRTIVREVEGLVDFFEINSVPWHVYSRAPSPLKHHGGGSVSGGAVKKFTRKLALDIRRLTSTPVVGPSVWDYFDLVELFEVEQFPAVSFGSIFLRYPWRPTLYVRRHLAEIAAHKKNLSMDRTNIIDP